jgi:palmitoyltransferase ZDHHC9/14/18
MSSQHSFSKPSQLPLPSSLSATNPHRPPPNLTVSSSSTSISPPTSPTWHHSRTHSVPQPSLSPTSPTFVNPPPITGSTHAGGIQPPSQFFHPSRPSHFSRPSSSSSSHNPELNLSSIQDYGQDQYPLDPITTVKRYSLTSAEDGTLDLPPEDTPQFATLNRLKQSREPLLPINTHRPTSRDRTDPNPPLSPRKQRAGTTGRAVRTSFDRMLGLSRGMSLDSLRRKSLNSTRDTSPPLTGRRATFESSRLPDEERGEATGSVYPLSPYKPSHSHSDFLHSSHHHPSPTPSSVSPSPVPSFIPTSPPDALPLAYTPLRKPGHKKPGRYIRRYELHPSRNRFIFGGLLLTGGDSPWAFVGSFMLLLGLAGVWFSTTCVFWWRREGPGGKVMVILGAYLAALVASSMLATVGLISLFLVSWKSNFCGRRRVILASYRATLTWTRRTPPLPHRMAETVPQCPGI